MRWLKLLAVLVLVVAVAYAEAGRKRRRRRRRRSRSRSSSTSSNVTLNHPSCYAIKDSWWQSREDRVDQQATVDAWDVTCANFDGDKAACAGMGTAARGSYLEDQIITASELQTTPCVYLGGGSTRCVGNPCNHLNNARCTLQETNGLCNWFTKAEAKKYGLEYGCQRNPCHIQGAGGSVTDDTCESRGIEGFIECTNCRGAIDPKLRGLKMGCQRVDVTSTAQCAPINDGTRALSSIMRLTTQKRCQCSTESPICMEMVSQRSSGYERRFPDDI
ncbi:Hypothetical Protein FCC1311_018362 [Hondaea fermentalgiana]|uniref:Uncharacterized protein n=1 Tax=Hondaea fermentalgiana TaxID=2315210 RepID=A0A2R5G3K0_9STRA|nr:Hypothetical Protein FCC1311_018362 [Hondaea fermentalgiana]|eukprot:GBG25617.1 Hypothetical Protein FCC1311_018362 [Hondaea fermentalgiana]